MNQNERRFDFHGLGAALKRAREEKGWTQAYVAELVDRDSRTIMNIENKGQYPSFDLFVKLITMFDISVDQFIHADGGAQTSSCRKHIDVLLNSMNEKELVVIDVYKRQTILNKNTVARYPSKIPQGIPIKDCARLSVNSKRRICFLVAPRAFSLSLIHISIKPLAA